MPVTRLDVFDAVTAALSAESCCEPSDLLTEGIHLSELAPDRGANPLRRRFPALRDEVTVTTMGKGIIVSATPNWMQRIADLYRDVQLIEAFSPRVVSEISRLVSRKSLRLIGPYAYHVTTSKDWVARSEPAGYSVKLGGAELLEPLNRADWPNATSLSALADGRHHVVAAVATRRGETAGVVAASADSDTLWQIGIDVRSDHRGNGLGAALTSRAARAILDQDRTPYYKTRIENIASRRTAQLSGFFPYWASLYTGEV